MLTGGFSPLSSFIYLAVVNTATRGACRRQGPALVSRSHSTHTQHTHTHTHRADSGSRRARQSCPTTDDLVGVSGPLEHRRSGQPTRGNPQRAAGPAPARFTSSPTYRRRAHTLDEDETGRDARRCPWGARGAGLVLRYSVVILFCSSFHSFLCYYGNFSFGFIHLKTL